MKIILCLFISFYSAVVIQAQPQTYAFAKHDKFITFVNESDSIAFPEYRKIDRKTQESIVTINKSVYKFLIRKTKHGRLQEIFDESGNRMATVFLDGVNENNIILADHTELKFKRTGKTNWAYFVGEKELIKSFYYFEGKTKKFVVQNYDSTVVSPVLAAITMEYGIVNSKNSATSKRTVGTMFAIAGAMAAVRFIISSAEEDL